MSIEGEIHNPKTYDIDDILKLAPLEERTYRLRCVEGWSMVIPWIGFSLSEIIKRAQPTGNAKYVQFITLADPKQMPGLSSNILEWPYSEGLRMDEAMNPLTLVTVGLYGQVLPKQDGAPVRIIVPWKYGLQECEVAREDPFRRQAAADELEPVCRERIRFLFERESRGRPSALESGDRTADRRGRLFRAEAQDVDVQRLRGSGCLDVPGHGLRKFY